MARKRILEPGIRIDQWPKVHIVALFPMQSPLMRMYVCMYMVDMDTLASRESSEQKDHVSSRRRRLRAWRRDDVH